MVKKSIKKFIIGLAAFSTINLLGSSGGSDLSISKSFFQPRAFSANLSREMMMEGFKHNDLGEWYGDFSATAVYQRSWTINNNNTSISTSFSNNPYVNAGFGLGTFPFWSGTNSMVVGSASSGSTPFNVDAYQFGLGLVTTPGSITLNPIVYQTGADFMFILGSHKEQSNFFAKIKAPIGIYNINPQLTEFIPTLPNPPVYAIGTLSDASTTTTFSLPATTMTQAFAGYLEGGQLSSQTPQIATIGNFLPMKYGLIDGDQSSGARIGDIEMTAGYRYFSEDNYIVSIALRAAAPTGNKAQGIYMLEPIFGRGGNWGLGGYVDGRFTCWEGNNENSLQVRIMADVMHLFAAHSVRSYDLIANGVGSKYLLVADYLNGIYQNQIGNLINYSTLASTSSFAVEGDVAIALTFYARNWEFDLGYEFWGRSAETLTITGDFPNQRYAVLGNQGVGTQVPNISANNCQPFAQINIPSQPFTLPATQNAGTVIATTQTQVVNAALAGNRIASSQLNIDAAQQAMSLTSKAFAQVAYRWIDSKACPHLGLMSEFEFSTSGNNALPQWSIALIGGVTF
ncbi:MAG: hypothetical protein JO129_02830 [Candidatus Dependentiae bacterium]|nr:hypothetical protein [Candidatus Dependentiae bacterium]